MSKDLFNKVIFGFRQGDIKSFEDLYFLTYKESLADIKYYIEDDEKLAWDIFKMTYIKLWERSSSVPEQNLLRTWIRILIKESFKEISFFEEIEISDFKDEFILYDDANIEQKAISKLIEIEDELQIRNVEESENKLVKIIKNTLKLIFLFFIAALAIFVLITVVSILKDILNLQKVKNPESIFIEKLENKDTIENKEELNKSIEENKQNIVLGWNDIDGKKQYKKSDGQMAQNEFLKINQHIYYFSSDAQLYTDILKKGIFEYNFSDDGALINIKTKENVYSTSNSFIEMLQNNSFNDRALNIIENSIYEEENWIYFLENLKYRNEAINLLRFNKDSKIMEKIAANVSGYINLDKRELAYCQNNEIKYFNKEEKAEKINKSYILDIKDNKYVFVDTFGDVLTEDKKKIISIDNRNYYLKNDYIEFVANNLININANEYSFAENKIYLNGSIYFEDGISITAMINIGEYIYYACIIDNKDNVQISKISRINTNTKYKEDMQVGFSGMILTMYYYKDYSGIYMEYLPNVPQNTYGKIAILSNENNFFVVNDDNFRHSLKDSNEMLEIIMVDKQGIHCYLSKGQVDESGNLELVNKKAIRINESSINFIGNE